MWMTGVHFQQHLFCVIRVRTSNWNALYVWTSCIEITRTKQTMKNHRSPFPGKVQGTSFVDQITVINSLPFHDTHCVWCTRRCVSDRETKTLWNLRHIVIPVLFFFFFCMNSSLANWMTAEKCGNVIPTTQRSPRLSMPETDLYNRGKKNKQTT